MSEDFWFGFAAFPAVLLGLAIVFCLLYLALHSVTYWIECIGCTWEVRPRRFEPWWVWRLRHRIAYGRHLRASEPCRAKANRWLANKGKPLRWSERGHLRKMQQGDAQ